MSDPQSVIDRIKNGRDVPVGEMVQAAALLLKGAANTADDNVICNLRIALLYLGDATLSAIFAELVRQGVTGLEIIELGLDLAKGVPATAAAPTTPAESSPEDALADLLSGTTTAAQPVVTPVTQSQPEPTPQPAQSPQPAPQAEPAAAPEEGKPGPRRAGNKLR